jgi:hypothetical protein
MIPVTLGDAEGDGDSAVGTGACVSYRVGAFEVFSFTA